MNTAIIVTKENKSITVLDLEKIETRNFLGDKISLTDFSKFSLNDAKGDVKFIGSTIFNIRVDNIKSVLFK